jgi:hypothetical protein
LENDLNEELYKKEVEESKRLRKEKADKKREEEKRSVFESDKCFTYKKLYNDMFVRTNDKGEHYIRSWKQIPELFNIKYAIFLYMDGRNTEGVSVREKLLDREDEYEIYELLYNSLVNEDFELPKDEYLQCIVQEFIDTLPSDLVIVTPEEIMQALNDPHDEIFNADETSQCSDDCGEDDKINNYEMDNK